MTTATVYSPSDVAKEVIAQGGSKDQAWVAAALVTGTESNGTLADKNPNSTACGLFQFLTTTWASNGGTQYAPTACQATFQQQVAVYLTASGGNNFYPWKPDFIPNGGPSNYDGIPIYSPQAGSKIANDIANLSAGGTLSFLGNVPTNWADAGNAQQGTPTPNPVVGGAGYVNPPNIPNPFQAFTDVNSFFKALGNGFGLGWGGIFTIILGIVMIGLGLIFLFRRQAREIGTAAIAAA